MSELHKPERRSRALRATIGTTLSATAVLVAPAYAAYEAYQGTHLNAAHMGQRSHCDGPTRLTAPEATAPYGPASLAAFYARVTRQLTRVHASVEGRPGHSLSLTDRVPGLSGNVTITTTPDSLTVSAPNGTLPVGDPDTITVPYSHGHPEVDAGAINCDDQNIGGHYTTGFSAIVGAAAETLS